MKQILTLKDDIKLHHDGLVWQTRVVQISAYLDQITLENSGLSFLKKTCVHKPQLLKIEKAVHLCQCSFY